MKKKKISLSTIAVILTVCFIVSYFIYHIVLASKDDIETQIAFKETVYSTIDTKGFVIRDEKFIKDQSSGTRISFVKNGERVGAGDTVSMVFKSADDAEGYIKITELKKKIQHYEELSGQVGHQIVNINSLSEKINNELNGYLEALENRDFQSAISNAEIFRDSVTGKQIAVGDDLDFVNQLDSLKNELTNAENAKYKYSEIKSENSGYFINGSDGYEDILDFDKIDKLTLNQVEKAVSEEPKALNDNIIGRSVSSFEWYIACSVPTEETVNITSDKKLSVNMPYEGIERLPVTLYKIGDREGKNTLLILKCDLMNEALADLRIEDIQIVTTEYTGYKINNSAIRTVDGEKGVYTLKGNIVEFKKIHIIYSTEEYTLVNNPDGSDNYILPYDRVVTKGVELKDDKLL